MHQNVLEGISLVQFGHEGAHPLLLNEGNSLVKGSIDAVVEVWVNVVIDTISGRP